MFIKRCIKFKKIYILFRNKAIISKRESFETYENRRIKITFKYCIITTTQREYRLALIIKCNNGNICNIVNIYLLLSTISIIEKNLIKNAYLYL